MKKSIRERLMQVAGRYEEIGLLLSDQEVFSDQNRFRDLSREYAQLEPVVLAWNQWNQAQSSIEEARQMMQEGDGELREMAAEELQEGQAQSEKLEREIQLLLLPKDPNDDNNIFLEIRAGTGGDEAAIFSGDLFHDILKIRAQGISKFKGVVISTDPGPECLVTDPVPEHV